MAKKPAALWFVSVVALAAAALLLVRRDARSDHEEPQTNGVRYSAGL